MDLFCPQGTRYQVFGAPHLGKSPMVFIHGVGLDLSLWHDQVEGLKAEHHIVTYDMLGHGLSPIAPTAETAKLWPELSIWISASTSSIGSLARLDSAAIATDTRESSAGSRPVWRAPSAFAAVQAASLDSKAA